MWHIRMLTLSYSIVLFLNFSFVLVVMVVLYWKILKEIKIIKSAIGKRMLWGLEFSGIRATSQYKTKSLVPIKVSFIRRFLSISLQWTKLPVLLLRGSTVLILCHMCQFFSFS